MDFTETWNWPQWTLLILYFLSMLGHAISHGKPRADYSFPTAVMSFALVMFVLIAGGFFA